METTTYFAVYSNRTPFEDRGGRPLAGGNRNSPFELTYDPQTKTVTATARVRLLPKDIRVAGANGKALNPIQSVPYQYDLHGKALSNNLPIPGCVVELRDHVGEKFRVNDVRARVESILNQKSLWLVLAKCRKGASCGCRVKVKFAIELLLAGKNEKSGMGKKVHREINLFPKAIRPDANSWGEEASNEKGRVYPFPDNSIAHECGHLFNFPDEYYGEGGWLHKMYIENGEVNFAKVDAENGKHVWQGYSDPNLMGGGCAKLALPNGGPTAAIDCYYANYIAREFNKMTGKIWRVGHVN